VVPWEENGCDAEMAGQKVSEDDDKESSCSHQGGLALLSCSGVGGMNEVGRRLFSVVGQLAALADPH
jgi:hypothetical protein